jgi:hypothetical protein
MTSTITTTREIITAALRALRMGGADAAYCRAFKSETRRLAIIRRHVAVPRGAGRLITTLAERLPRPAVAPPVLSERLRTRLARVYTEVIAERGGETTIEGSRSTEYLYCATYGNGLALLRADGWRQYSRAYGARPATLAYLCGADDNGRWAVRVPGTCTSITAALQFVEPADVRKARAAQRPLSSAPQR